MPASLHSDRCLPGTEPILRLRVPLILRTDNLSNGIPACTRFRWIHGRALLYCRACRTALSGRHIPKSLVDINRNGWSAWSEIRTQAPINENADDTRNRY